MIIRMSQHDLQILRLSHGPARVTISMIDKGVLTSDDCRNIWPHAFRGNMNLVVSVLREAGYHSARISHVL